MEEVYARAKVEQEAYPELTQNLPNNLQILRGESHPTPSTPHISPQAGFAVQVICKTLAVRPIWKVLTLRNLNPLRRLEDHPASIIEIEKNVISWLGLEYRRDILDQGYPLVLADLRGPDEPQPRPIAR